METKTYIGDGVYAEFDGYGVTLSTERPVNQGWDTETHYIYLEPDMIDNIQRFYYDSLGRAKE